MNATLDLTWLVLGLVALSSAALFYFCRSFALDRERRVSLFVGVAMIIAALFPYISSTDDSLRFDHYAAQHRSDHHHSSTGKSIAGLMLLYEAADSALPIQAFHLVVTWILAGCVGLVAASCEYVVSPWNSGRSPPSLAL